MTKMYEGFTRLFTGKDSLPRQITLFSICGIVGLFHGYIALGAADILWKYIFAAVSILFTMFLTGYEILFMKERKVPDIDMRSLKLFQYKIPLAVFLICIPLTLVSLFAPHCKNQAFLIETILAVPLTMIQAGFCYNFNDSDWNMLFQKFKLTDYALLFLKRIWIIILAYIITFSVIFCTFFIIGFAAAITYKGDLTAIGFMISSRDYAIKAISTYMTGVLTVYTLTIGTLIWDYELIKTYEREVK